MKLAAEFTPELLVSDANLGAQIDGWVADTAVTVEVGTRVDLAVGVSSTGATLVPFLLDGVGGVTELNQADRIHPNPAGHAIMAETVWKVLRPLL